MKRVPIFPLPRTVFFPEARLPLHVFEPRYRQMAEDVLASDGLLVIVLLRPGWESDYFGAPAVHELGTLGRVEKHERLNDGRYQLLLGGIERVRLEAKEEGPPPGKLYRIRRARPAPESAPIPGPETTKLGRRLRSLWDELAQASPGASGPAGERIDAPFGVLVNRIANRLDAPPEARQLMLEQDDLLERGRLVEAYLEERLRLFRFLADYRRAAPEDPRVN